MRYLALFTVLSLLSASVLALPSDYCSDLKFIAVDYVPNNSPSKVECDKSKEAYKCIEKEGFDKIKKLSIPKRGEFFVLKRIKEEDLSDDAKLAMIMIRKSKAVRRVGQLKIKAKRLSGNQDPCMEHLIYMGEEQIFGVGPVFTEGRRYLLEDYKKGKAKIFDNLIVADQGELKGLKILSNMSLIYNGYFDYVIGHEVAHGIMQDLMGIETIKEIAGNIKSKDYHLASSITDPSLAWIEGFAIGFESYLRKQYFKKDERDVPNLAYVYESAKYLEDIFNKSELLFYPASLLSTTAVTANNLLNLDNFSSEFLIANRGQAIFENHYISKGLWSNIINRYDYQFHPGITVQDMIDLTGHTPEESNDVVYSKEGVVGHVVYYLLNKGLENEVFETMAIYKPRNVYDFYKSLKNYYELNNREDFPHEVFIESFTHEGRLAKSLCFQEMYKREFLSSDYMATYNNLCPEIMSSLTHKDDKSRIEYLLGKITRPTNPLWIEFKSNQFLRKNFYGELDRINLKTVAPYRFSEYLKGVDKNAEAGEIELAQAIMAQIQSSLENKKSSLHKSKITVTKIANVFGQQARMAFKKYQETGSLEDHAKFVFLGKVRKSLTADRNQYLYDGLNTQKLAHVH